MNSIGVQSVPELYGVLLGWMQYNQVWQLLEKTGVAFVPFIVLLVTHSIKPYLSQRGGHAVATSVKTISLECISALLVIFIACVPCIPLHPHHNLLEANNTHTTFDKAFALTPQTMPTIRVPIWWYGVMSLSEGITNALIHELPPRIDLRRLVATVKLTTVHDPKLRQALQQFYTQCYLPARQKFLADNTLSQTPKASDRDASGSIDNLLKKLRSSEDKTTPHPDWLGSSLFVSTPGYYDSFRAAQAVTDFDFDPQVDWQDHQDKTQPLPHWGRPTCRDWWIASKVGLRDRLLALFPQGVLSQLLAVFSDRVEQVIDSALQTLLTSTPGYQSANHLIGDLSLAHLSEALGVWKTMPHEYAKLYAILQAAPLVRALLLLFFYTFLPFGLVFSRYRFSTLVTGSLFLFSLIFWSYIWQLIAWLDNVLIKAFYGNWLFQQTPQALLANGVIGLLMIIAPLFWFTVMGVLGVAAGKGLDRLLTGLVDPIGLAGESGRSLLTGPLETIAGGAVQSEVATLAVEAML